MLIRGDCEGLYKSAPNAENYAKKIISLFCLIVVIGVIMTIVIPGRVATYGAEKLSAKTVKNWDKIQKLIKCESSGINISRPDSDGVYSDGVLQFHRDKKTPNLIGSGTWADMSRRSGIKGSPIDPEDAIRMADWMISNGYIGRWTCTRILKLK